MPPQFDQRQPVRHGQHQDNLHLVREVQSCRKFSDNSDCGVHNSFGQPGNIDFTVQLKVNLMQERQVETAQSRCTGSLLVMT